MDKQILAVQTFGKKATALAVARCKAGDGEIKVNGVPLHLIQPEIMRAKAFEPLILMANSGTFNPYKHMNMRIRVKGGGVVSQIYAIRQAIAKAGIAFCQKNVDETTKRSIKDILLAHDRSLIVADPRKREAKKFGGPGARGRYTKSYR